MASFKCFYSASHKREQLLKYMSLLAILLAYFGYLSWEYGLASGGSVALLTWSFFVLCTPVADAGFLVAFPLRVITGVKMLYSQITISVFAVLLNVGFLSVGSAGYDKTPVTRLLHEILVQPWPYWGLIALCALGTMLSVMFGDEVLDVASHKERDRYHAYGFKYRVLVVVAFFGLIVLAYYELIESLGIEAIVNGG